MTDEKSCKPCSCALNFKSLLDDIQNYLQNQTLPSKEKLEKLKQDIFDTAEPCRIKEREEVKDALSELGEEIERSESGSETHPKENMLLVLTHVANMLDRAVRETASKEEKPQK